MANKKGVVVGGTHGKTTTSALTAHVLRQGGLKPSHYVGAEIPILGANAHWDSEGVLFVVEGELNLTLSGKSHVMQPGGYAYVPSGTWSCRPRAPRRH